MPGVAGGFGIGRTIEASGPDAVDLKGPKAKAALPRFGDLQQRSAYAGAPRSRQDVRLFDPAFAESNGPEHARPAKGPKKIFGERLKRVVLFASRGSPSKRLSQQSLAARRERIVRERGEVRGVDTRGAGQRGP